MASGTIQPQQYINCGDFPNGTSVTAVRNGYYRVVPGASPAEGLPSGFTYCALLKARVDAGYYMIILTDIYGRLAVWSTQNNAWVVH